MADGVTLNSGTGGAVIATDDIGSVHYQRVKISLGADGAAADLAVTNPMPSGGDIAHDTGDSGLPVKIGFKALSALPTAVTTADRANGISDLYGRQLTAHIDPGMQTCKSFNATSAQTGIDIWTPGGGKKIAITSIVIGTYGTTAGRVILFFSANADTTFSEGTDQTVLKASFAPSTTSKPGLVFTPAVPIYSATADYELHITTDAAISIDVTVHGYEFT